MNKPRQFTSTIVYLAALIVTAATSARAADAFKASPEKEKELLAVLRSDAPAADKAIACKKLAIDGSSEAVPDLAKLLPDAQLSSWARIALEAIPGAAADEALRKAAESLEGRLLVGTINSIGVRRDVNAVEALTARMKDKDDEVASAAAVALGRIGNAAAAKSLRASLANSPVKVRSAVAEGCVLCAERLHAEGKSAEAVAIYDEVRKAEVPKQRIIEATRGAILARKDEGIPLLLEQFRSTDKKLFELALGTAREFPGGEVDKALAAELAKATPERAALLIQAMADRKETVVVAAVMQAAGSGPKPVRLAAISALGRVGDASCLATLLETAVDADEDLALAAKATLAELPGEKVDAQIAALLPNAKGKSYPLLIELVGQRRIEATPALIKALDHSDNNVRSAAFIALGETVALKGLPVLISQAVSPKHAEDAAVAQQALKAASIRMPDREACAAELTSALNRSPAAIKTTLLEILADVGGDKALKTVGAAAKSNDPQLQDVGSRLLGVWNSLDAAPVLLELAKTGPAPQFRNRALKGYIALARKFDMPDQQRAEMCQKAFDLSRQTAEQKAVLNVLKIHPSTETLKLAIKAMLVPELKEDATQTTLVIAQKLGAKGVDVREQLNKAGLDKVKLEIIKAEYGAGATQKDVTAVLQKQVGDLPLITLISASYNASFGGDPTPGSTKQLKIQYRINGKPGEASFPEDALIVLPMPK
ncbi:MAG TPA: HEAT repeat domain-containing protein [Planctomycetaceae bacterium]|nr:HEAT repeat domain-containing protein [Planctomycetaceae bacterium]